MSLRISQRSLSSAPRGAGAGSRASGDLETSVALWLTAQRGDQRLHATRASVAGNDWDRAVARGLPEGWVSLDQWADTRTGDTFWSQYTNQQVAAAGTQVTVGDLAPTNDQWNMVAIELPGAD
jgi:hypothetical protein